MDYLKLYNDLVAHRKQNPVKGYTENHHIVMRSMGGSDTDDNLVSLTGREHWIAHLLLYKIHRNSQTVHACNMMAMRCEERGIAYIKNSRAYEFVRKQHAKLTSERNKISHKGESNSQYDTRWICNIQIKQNKKIHKNEYIPDGWVLGKNKWNMIYACLECNTNFIRKCNEKICSSDCRKISYSKNRKPATDKTKEILSESAKKRATENPSSVHKDTIWINNGTMNKRISKFGKIPESWNKGKLKRVYAL